MQGKSTLRLNMPQNALLESVLRHCRKNSQNSSDLLNPLDPVFHLLIQFTQLIEVFFTGFPVAATVHLQ